MKNIINPYSDSIPELEDHFFHRDDVVKNLETFFCNARLSNRIIVAERGIGARASVRHFLNHSKNELSFRFVQCDVAKDLGTSGDATKFYRSLVRFLSKQLQPLPDNIQSIVDMILSTSGPLYEIDFELIEFFELISNIDGKPLLLVFYSFDQLPTHFQFDPLDWTLLKQFGDTISYLIISRRPVVYLEKAYNLEFSQFGLIFSPPYYVGLVEETLVNKIIMEPTSEISLRDFWPDWLVAHIIDWGGNNFYCIQCICFELFRYIQKAESFSKSELASIEDKMYIHLHNYFESLYKYLHRDEFLQPINNALKGNLVNYRWQIQELQQMGYLIPEHDRFRLFSPLFKRYLEDKNLFEQKEKSNPITPIEVRTLPLEVSKLLDPVHISKDIDLWFDSYIDGNKRIKSSPSEKKYILQYLTGILEDLSKKDLMTLRKNLYHQYKIEREDEGHIAQVQSAFYQTLKRWADRYRADS